MRARGLEQEAKGTISGALGFGLVTCFASDLPRDGVSLFYLSRIMGTSIAQLDATYGHLVPDSDEYVSLPHGRRRR